MARAVRMTTKRAPRGALFRLGTGLGVAWIIAIGLTLSIGCLQNSVQGSPGWLALFSGTGVASSFNRA